MFRRKIAVVFPAQFGYFPDILEYSRILSEFNFPVIFIGINENKEIINLPNDSFRAYHLNCVTQPFYDFVSTVLEKEHPEIVHVFHFRGAGLLRVRNRNSRAKWIIDVRTLHVGNVKGEMKGLYFKDKLTHLETLVYDYILVLTEKIKEKLKPNPRKIVTIPLAGSKSKFDVCNKSDVRDKYRKSLEINNSDVVFIYAGTVNPSRKVEVLIRYFVKATSNISNVKLLVVGGDSMGGGYVDELKRLSSSNIIFTGKVKYTDVQNYYFASDVGISYLPPGTPYEYQPATKVLEYMLAKILVFANETLTQKEVTPNTIRGILFKDHYESFLERFQHILDILYSQDHKSLVDNAYNYAKEYTWESIVEKRLIPFYEKL